jgi:glucose/mannose-6-phosphate isomerase
MIKDLIEKFPEQLSDALEIGKHAELHPASSPIQNVLIAGMGGSGIGGIMAMELAGGQATVPIVVFDGYDTPAYVGKQSLVIASSYSGDTEETLEAYEKAKARGAKVVSVASGGKLIAKSKEEGIDHILIPGGMPPRSAVGYSLVQILYILNFFGIIDQEFKKEVSKASALLMKEKETINSIAKSVGEKLINTIPVIYAPHGYEGVAVCMSRQLNENSKMLNWHAVIPEMNHNELVGWAGGNKGISAVFIRNDNDNKRIAKRTDVVKEVVKGHTDNIVEVFSKGESNLERMMYHLYVGAIASIVVAEMKGVDPDEIEIVKHLKKELENFKA